MSKFLDSNGVSYLWQQLSLQDYLNNETLVSVINAIDSIKVSKTDLIDLVYSVGAIYISVNSTSPKDLFGGTWEQIKDTFLLSAGDSYTAGSTGGEATYTLTKAQTPFYTTGEEASGYGIMTNSGFKDRVIVERPSKKSTNNINNMPPYLTVYMWKRIS